MQIAQRLQQAYEDLIRVKIADSQAQEVLRQQKEQVDILQAEARVNGLPIERDGGKVDLVSWADLGKNEAERQAAFMLGFSKHYGAAEEHVETSRQKAVQARLALDLAELAWQHARLQLKALELGPREGWNE